MPQRGLIRHPTRQAFLQAGHEHEIGGDQSSCALGTRSSVFESALEQQVMARTDLDHRILVSDLGGFDGLKRSLIRPPLEQKGREEHPELGVFRMSQNQRLDKIQSICFVPPKGHLGSTVD
jgi:hypothetical protein